MNAANDDQEDNIAQEKCLLQVAGREIKPSPRWNLYGEHVSEAVETSHLEQPQTSGKPIGGKQSQQGSKPRTPCHGIDLKRHQKPEERDKQQNVQVDETSDTQKKECVIDLAR